LCGGPDTSWRDLYCEVCQSCYEIKSKADKAAINGAFSADSFNAGSYRRWCEEDFPDRVIGSDYIVFVSRTQTDKGWAVEIAEIGTVLPVLCDKSFAEANEKTVSIQTCMTMKNRQPRFHIPRSELLNLKTIFRLAFEKVFPDQWKQVGGTEDNLESRTPITDVPALPSSRGPTRHHPASIEEITAALEHFSVANWDSDSD
jgi:hypothetical protein